VSQRPENTVPSISILFPYSDKVSPSNIGNFVACFKVKILANKCLHKIIPLFYYRGHVNGYVSEWPHRQGDSEPHLSHDPFRCVSDI
jgi:hypothetical protein